MAQLLALFTTFHGRISRVEWWLGQVVLAVFELMVGWLLFGRELFTSNPFIPYWPTTLWKLIGLVLTAALTVKRFNDCGRPSWVGPMCIGIAVIAIGAPHMGLYIGPRAQGIGLVLCYVFTVIGLCGLVDNAFGPGTRGPNRYGPDPLTRSPQPA